MVSRPVGTVTFLMTDIEGSTRRWEEQPESMRAALARHDDIIAHAVKSNDGWLFKHTGDGVIAAFGSARYAIDAAIVTQRRLELPVRMGICSGAVELRGGDYFGPPLNRAARIMEVGNGGQILVAASTASLVDGLDLIDLGEHRLRDLSQPQHLWQVRAAGLRQDFPPLRTLDAAAGNLRSQATSFLGREKDIADIAAMLHRTRLVTLTGIGGVGKTRLSLQVAAEVSPYFHDGAWQVQLASVLDPAAIGHAVAAVFGVTQQPGQTIEQSIVVSLGRRQLLLVLDNCEHLIQEAAALARAIMAQCPQVSLLATSREALMIEGEQVCPVTPLGFGEGILSPAVELFVERAQAVAPDFVVNGDSNDVSEICRRLDGIPLAIELAAARIRAMSPAQIRARLDDRFRLLIGGPRHGLERHQTLRHAVQWSFDLLTPAERAVLSRSAVFAGGFSLEAAERVCAGGEIDEAHILDLLDGLVRKSLVAVDRSAGVVRYSLLETMRQFGEDQLAAMRESDAARDRHAQYFAEDGRANFELWRSPRQIEAYRWLDREMGNLRAAFRWSVDRGDIETAGNIASNLGDIGLFQLRHEVKLWAAEIVDAARSTRHRRLPMILTWVASAEWYNERNLDTAMRYAQEALDLSELPDFDSFIWAHADQAFIAALQGDFDLSVERAHAGAAHPVDRQDRLCTALRGYFLAMAGRHDEAMRVVGADVAAAEATRIPYSMAVAYYSKGRAFADADPPAAIAAYERAIAIAHESGNLFWEQLVVADMAALQARAGNPKIALGMFRQMLDTWQGSPDAMGASHGIGGLIILFDRLGQSAQAVTLHAALMHYLPSLRMLEELPAAIERARTALGDTAFNEAMQRGAVMEPREMTEFARTEIAHALSIFS
jgi:predicted ATPase